MSKKIHMARRATITYDLLGREVGIDYMALPICRDSWLGLETPKYEMVKFPFDVTCKKCKKLIQDEHNRRYQQDKEARLRAGLPERGDYVYTKDIP